MGGYDEKKYGEEVVRGGKGEGGGEDEKEGEGSQKKCEN